MNFNVTGRSYHTLSGNKQMFNSTLSSFNKTPSKSNFMIRRSSSSSSFRNTQGKLDSLKQDLLYLESDIKGLRDVTKVNFLS